MAIFIGKPLLRLIGFCTLAVAVAACAKQGSFSGGSNDTTAPVLQYTRPAVPALNFKERKVVFSFDEYIKAGATYGKEVFISPLPPQKPKIITKNKKLIIEFTSSLLDSTTYVVTLLDIADFNAGNKLTAPITAAIATGSTLDSMTLKGNVKTADAMPAKDITLLLFDADSIKNDVILNKKPMYIGKSDANGGFVMPYLRKISYKLYGCKDTDNSNTYSLADEGLALAASPDVRFPDSAKVDTCTLYYSAVSQKKPAFKGAKWLNDSLLAISFSRGLRIDSLQMTIADTLGGDSQPLLPHLVLPTKEHELLVVSPRNKSLYSTLTLRGICDSLGNRADTIARVLPNRMRSMEKNQLLLVMPAYNAPRAAAEWYMPLPIADSQKQRIVVLDSAQKPLNLPIEWNSLAAKIALPSQKRSSRYTLQIPASALPPQKGMKPDSLLSFPIDFPNPETLSSISGTVSIEGYQSERIILRLSAGGGKAGRGEKGAEAPAGNAWISYGKTFSFKHLPAGKYTATVTLDLDNNGVFTPGGLQPYHLPESVIMVSEPIDIKPNWEYEAYEIKITRAAPSAPKRISTKGEKK